MALDFLREFMRTTPARYSLHNSTTGRSISMLPAVNSANNSVKKARNYPNSPKIQCFGAASTLPWPRISHHLDGFLPARPAIPASQVLG